MAQIPFPPYVQPGTQAYQKGIFQLPKNYCYVSTLNGKDVKKAYTYRAFRIAIPKGLIEKAKKTGNHTGRVTFRYASQKALSRTEADTATFGKGGIVRMVRCRIPKSQKIVDILFDQFTKFGKASWVSQYKSALEGVNKEDSIHIASRWVKTCTEQGSWCIGGARCNNPDNWTTYCKEYIWTRVGEGGGTDGSDGSGSNGGNGEDENNGGGRGGRGGKQSDPCSPRADGSIPAGCREPDPCIGPYPPEYCQIEDPCPRDPVPSPEIAPTEGQGLAGGLFGAPRADGTPHRGIDIKSPIGGSLFSMFGGTVYAAFESEGDFGTYIIIQSIYEGETIYVLYAHLSSLGVHGNQYVSQGELIGLTGKTGNADDPDIVPHVHIEVRKQVPQYGYNDAPYFNPENYMATKFDDNGNPIPPENCN